MEEMDILIFKNILLRNWLLLPFISCSESDDSEVASEWRPVFVDWFSVAALVSVIRKR